MKGRKQYSYSTPSKKNPPKATRFFIKEVYHLPFFALSSFNPHTHKYSQNFVKVVVIVVVNPKTVTKKNMCQNHHQKRQEEAAAAATTAAFSHSNLELQLE